MIENYLRDETPESMRPQPAKDIVLVKPANTKDVAEIIKFANENRICVFPRGGGTGLVGGAIPTMNGIVVSLERMTKVEVDKSNLMVISEAGAPLEKLASAVKDANLRFPLHPGDETAQIGGMVATNAGGVNAVRYGVTRNYVKGIEVVLPSGKVLALGGKLQKNNVGYDLMQLIIGSEGTLGIITKVILRLYPESEVSATLIIPYDNRHDAMRTVPRILQDGRLPLAIEYVEKDLMERTAKALGENWPVVGGNCYLLVTVAEIDRDRVLSASARIAEISQESGCLEILCAETTEDQSRIWKIRSGVYSALKADTADLLDVTVPPANIGKLIDAVDDIARKHRVSLPAYGHAGDGNLHVHIMKEQERGTDFAQTLRNEIYRTAADLEGVITGEHGIGRTRIDCIDSFMDRNELDLMRKIKKIFDPNNILNPGAKITI
jgi:glycolate oxidase